MDVVRRNVRRAGRLRSARAQAGLLALLSVAGCSGPPPPPPPTVAKLTIEASPGANATADGRGAPTIVRVYQLAATSAFDKAEFFRLLNADAATLGPDLVKKDEYLLAPGTSKIETMTLPDRVQAIGVFAAYRQFQDRAWRVTVPLPPNKTTPVVLSVGAGGLAAGPAS